jgi:hypothetical protein
MISRPPMVRQVHGDQLHGGELFQRGALYLNT